MKDHFQTQNSTIEVLALQILLPGMGYVDAIKIIHIKITRIINQSHHRVALRTLTMTDL
jgi:hypothetical protein